MARPGDLAPLLANHRRRFGGHPPTCHPSCSASADTHTQDQLARVELNSKQTWSYMGQQLQLMLQYLEENQPVGGAQAAGGGDLGGGSIPEIDRPAPCGA